MRRDWKNKNSHVICLITFMFTGLLFVTEDMKKKIKVQVPQRNDNFYTILQLVLLVKMKKIIANKILNGRYLKNLMLQKLV